MDEEVLRSNDWEKYRPRVVICEDLEVNMEKIKDSRVAKLLLDLDYSWVGKTPYSLIFRDKRQELC